MSSTEGRLRDICEAAARGSFPVPSWVVEFLPSPAPTVGAVIAFTGHHVVAAAVDEGHARSRLDTTDPASCFRPAFLTWLGEQLGARAGHVDVTLARLGSGFDDGWLVPTVEPPDNERVQRARRLRSEVVYLVPPDHDAVVTLGRGLAGRWELSMEVDDETRRGRGLGTRMVMAAVGRVPIDEAVFASVAPGNTRSLRCLLRAGFRPIGAECVYA